MFRRTLLFVNLLVIGLLPIRFAEAQVSTLTAPSVQSTLQEFLQQDFKYIGHVRLFGYEATESCIWSSKKMIFVEHYCQVPSAPARSFTLWSKEFGSLQFYEEDIGSAYIREVRLNYFPEGVKAQFPDDFSALSADQLSQLMGKMYNQWQAACWSTNYDQNTQAPAAECYLTDIKSYPFWSDETQSLVNDPSSYAQIRDEFLAKVSH